MTGVWLTPVSGAAARFVASLVTLAAPEGSRAPLATIFALLVGVAMAAVHIAQTWAFFLPSGQFKNLHIGLALALCALGLLEATPVERRRLRIGLALLALLTAVPLVYIHVEYTELVEVRSLFPEPPDLWIAILMLLVASIVAGLQWGWSIPALAAGAIVYGRYGDLLPGDLLWHGGLGWERLISYTSIPNFQGLLGPMTELSAGTIFMFMLFAGVLGAAGGVEFIIALGQSLGGRSRGGPAQVAVLSSGFMGMISGSSVANVAATGVFTIPMMKRAGFKPEFAGAVEAVASTGGQITPPMLGLAAFLIVGLTDIPYAQIMAATVFPALIYYAHLMVAIHLRTFAIGLDARQAPADAEAPTLREAFRRYGHLLVGIGVLVTFLMLQMPPANAALYALAALLALDAAKRLYDRRGEPAAGLIEIVRMSLRGLLEGARGGAQIAVVIAVIGVLIEILAVTGFAQKLSNMMLEIADGRLWSLLLMSAATCLVFGLGLPTSAAYILVALLGAPAMIKLGVPVLAAHMFVFFFANISALTPPVAVAALVASNIAKSRFFPTALIAVQLGLPGFLLPFLFVIRPEILGIDSSFGEQALVSAIALAAVIALNMAIEGYMLRPMRAWERLLILPAAFGMLDPGWLSTAIGLALLGLVAGRQYLLVRREAATLRGLPVAVSER